MKICRNAEARPLSEREKTTYGDCEWCGDTHVERIEGLCRACQGLFSGGNGDAGNGEAGS